MVHWFEVFSHKISQAKNMLARFTEYSQVFTGVNGSVNDCLSPCDWQVKSPAYLASYPLLC